MARFVDEVMNTTVFSLKPGDAVEQALTEILALGVSGAPVVEGDVCVGTVSIRNLVHPGGQRRVEGCMRRPPIVVPSGTSLEDASALICQENGHRAVVIDSDGKMLGLVSTLDLLRGLAGLPATHAPILPRHDRRSGLEWTEDQTLEEAAAKAAPDRSGVFALIHGGAGIEERVVWVEATDDLRESLISCLEQPEQHAHIEDALASGQVRFRYALSFEVTERMRAVKAVLAEARERRRQRLSTMGQPEA